MADGKQVLTVSQLTLKRDLRSTILGKVFLGHDARSKETVVVKVSSLAKQRSQQYKEDAEREASILSGLDHPHIVTLRGVVEARLCSRPRCWRLLPHADGAPSALCERHAHATGPATTAEDDQLNSDDACHGRGPHLVAVYDWCAGGDLLDHIISTGAPSEATARRMFKQLLSALDYLHKRGVFHQDISLENVLLKDTSSSDVALIDFGLAIVNKLSSQFPASRDRAGKSRYRAPEHYSGQAFDAVRADLYSLGVLLFVLLTGVQPYSRPYDSAYRFVTRRRNAKLLAAWRKNNPSKIPKLSVEAIDLLDSMLVEEPSERLTLRQVLEHAWVVAGDENNTSCNNNREEFDDPDDNLPQ